MPLRTRVWLMLMELDRLLDFKQYPNQLYDVTLRSMLCARVGESSLCCLAVLLKLCDDVPSNQHHLGGQIYECLFMMPRKYQW
jgi:hypothetical protein